MNIIVILQYLKKLALQIHFYIMINENEYIKPRIMLVLQQSFALIFSNTLGVRSAVYSACEDEEW